MTKQSDLIRVVLKLPHDQLVMNMRAREEAPEIQHCLFMPELCDWIHHYRLNQAPDIVHILKIPDYDFSIERRIHNMRGYGSVGGWVKKTTHVNFYFRDKRIAILFKLTWGGE